MVRFAWIESEDNNEEKSSKGACFKLMLKTLSILVLQLLTLSICLSADSECCAGMLSVFPVALWRVWTLPARYPWCCSWNHEMVLILFSLLASFSTPEGKWIRIAIIVGKTAASVAKSWVSSECVPLANVYLPSLVVTKRTTNISGSWASPYHPWLCVSFVVVVNHWLSFDKWYTSNLYCNSPLIAKVKTIFILQQSNKEGFEITL